jgi:MFS family permease
LAGRFVHGVGLSSYITASYAYVADIAPSHRRAEAVGLFSAAYALALVIGPVIGFWLIASLGFQQMFYVTTGLYLTALAISLLAKERRPATEIRRQAWSLRSGIVCVEALPVAWTMFCMGMGIGTLTTFIAIFAQSRGIQNPGYYFMVQAVALLISRTFTGTLADRYGRSVVIVPGFILMSASLALLPWAQGFAWFVLSASLYGFGFGSAQPAAMALLIDRIQPEKRGLAISTFFTGFDGGISVGAMLLGLVSQYWGFGTMWTIVAIFILLGLAGLLADSLHPGSAAP